MVVLPVIIPLLAALLGLFNLPMRRIAKFALLLNFAISVCFAVIFIGCPLSVTDFSFKVLENPDIHLQFGLTGISCIMILLTSSVSLAAIFCKIPETLNPQQVRLWISSILLLSAGAMGAFLSTDLFFFYAFHELALIPTFLMIGMFGRGERTRIAWQTTIFLAVGSIILLAGVIGLGSIAGTYQIADLPYAIQEKLSSFEGDKLESLKCSLTWISGLLLVGYGTLVSLFPFHTWAAPAYASAPAPIAMLHAGVLKKFGLYGLIITGLNVMPEQFKPFLTVLTVLLLCNIIWVGLITINQRRLDEMLGYSSVMHMGYIFLALAAFIAFPESKIALSAAVLLMFGHGISIALSFYLTDIIERKTGTLEFNQLGGLAKSAPKLALLFGIAGMASIGLPGLANFAGEVMVFFAGFEGWDSTQSLGIIQWATIIALWGVVISAVYLLRAFKQTFHGSMNINTKNVLDLSLAEKLPAYFLSAILIAVGVYPKLLLQFINSL